MPVQPTRTVHLTRHAKRDVLNLLSEHKTDREIAETMVVSPLTVRTYIEHLSEKLHVMADVRLSHAQSN